MQAQHALAVPAWCVFNEPPTTRRDAALAKWQHHAIKTIRKVRVAPLRGVNFGSIKYGETRERVVEVRNEGEFPFSWSLVKWGSDADLALQADNAKMAKGEVDPVTAAVAVAGGAPAHSSNCTRAKAASLPPTM